MTRTPSLAAVAALALLSACGGSAGAPETRSDGSTAASRGWPQELLTGAGTGPALYLGADADDPPIGYISPAVRLRVAGPPRGDRIPVVISGPMKVRGWLSMSRLAARVQRRGRVRGAPVYVGTNDLVGVLGESRPGILRVEVRPELGRAEHPTIGPFIGEYPASRLGVQELPPESAEPPRRGEMHALPSGQEVAVYARPGGDVVATLPALDPPLVIEVVKQRGDWKAVRVGKGPYLIGFVNAPLEVVQNATGDGAGIIGTAASTGTVPSRLADDTERPLWRVPAGTRVRFNGATIAIFEEPGYVREMNRYDQFGEADVFAAANDEVAVRGMVRISDLQPADGAAPSSAPAAPEQPAAAPPPAPEPTPAP